METIQPITAILERLKATKDNHQFLPVIADFTWLQGIVKRVQAELDSQESSQDFIQIVREQIIASSTPLLSQPQEYLALIEALHLIFIRENITGPSVYSLYVEEEKRPLIKGEPLRKRPELDSFSTKNTVLQKQLLDHFERDSEQMYIRTQLLPIFYALEILLVEHPNLPTLKENATEGQRQLLNLWSARFFYLYDKQMTSNVAHLKDHSLELYEHYVTYLGQCTDMADFTQKKALAIPKHNF